MLGVFVEFETNLRRERLLGGIADAKARGVYKGRKATIDPANIKQMKADGVGTICHREDVEDRPRFRSIARSRSNCLCKRCQQSMLSYA
jgi:DNA invertase Pin-like site-specific DNA recombinase